MIDRGKHNILGIGISAVDYDAAVNAIISAACERRSLTVTALAVHGVMTGVGDKSHHYRLNHLDLVVPDGQPVRWALNFLYKTKLPDRVYGPNLMLRVCESASNKQLPIALFGGTEDMLEKLRQSLLAKYPDLKIAITIPSKFRKFSTNEQAELLKQISDSGAKIAMIGIGCPRQEIWVYENRNKLNMPMLAVGAAFAFHAGSVSQAPVWMQDRGLEWLFRLISEPKRLWRRYLFLNPAYLALLALQATGLKKISTESNSEPTEEFSYG